MPAWPAASELEGNTEQRSLDELLACAPRIVPSPPCVEDAPGEPRVLTSEEAYRAEESAVPTSALNQSSWTVNWRSWYLDHAVRVRMDLLSLCDQLDALLSRVTTMAEPQDRGARQLVREVRGCVDLADVERELHQALHDLRLRNDSLAPKQVAQAFADLNGVDGGQQMANIQTRLLSQAQDAVDKVKATFDRL